MAGQEYKGKARSATPLQLAFIATQKYVDGIPLHRQEATFARIGVSLDRGTAARGR